MIEKIILPNRYKEVNCLQFVNEESGLLWYKFIPQHSNSSLRVAVINEKNNEYCMLDPSGGPYMEIDNFEIENMKLKKIIFKSGYTLGFEK